MAEWSKANASKAFNKTSPRSSDIGRDEETSQAATVLLERAVAARRPLSRSAHHREACEKITPLHGEEHGFVCWSYASAFSSSQPIPPAFTVTRQMAEDFFLSP
ncbi:MAG: hypothetical protein H6728_16860 [Myxococcales bacterium]|nr:hypothetical protein [Myxococcales bacterium]MCB9644744.1 hypothetical protein [Myxococcales bacterium]